MESENQTAAQMQGANTALMNNPFLLLPNLLLMPLYLFAQLISGMFGTIPAVTPYQFPPLQSLPPSSEGETQSPSQQSVPPLLQIPRTTYTNTEEWELKRDKSGRLQAIIIHRKATEGGEVIDV